MSQYYRVSTSSGVERDDAWWMEVMDENLLSVVKSQKC